MYQSMCKKMIAGLLLAASISTSFGQTKGPTVFGLQSSPYANASFPAEANVITVTVTAANDRTCYEQATALSIKIAERHTVLFVGDCGHDGDNVGRIIYMQN